MHDITEIGLAIKFVFEEILPPGEAKADERRIVGEINAAANINRRAADPFQPLPIDLR